MIDWPGWGFGIGQALSGVLGAVFSLLVLVVTIAVVFLLVRFLLIATKAAQLYVAQGERARTGRANPQPGETAPTQPLPPSKPNGG